VSADVRGADGPLSPRVVVVSPRGLLVGARAAASEAGLYVVARTHPVRRPMAVTGLDVGFGVFPELTTCRRGAAEDCSASRGRAPVLQARSLTFPRPDLP
jgi:hypothetical protein